MRLTVFTLCLFLSIFATAQSFQWDNKQTSEQHSSSSKDFANTGLAHFYPDYYEDSPTALGEIFHHDLMTAGHQKLPLGTLVKVTRADNGLSTTVRINDRGAYCDGCVIDLSRVAAEQIQLVEGGRTTVTLSVVGTSDVNPSMDSYSAVQPQFTSKGGEPSFEEDKREVNLNQNNNIVTCGTNANPGGTALQVKGGADQQQGNNEITTIDFPISPYSVQLGSYEKYSNAERHVLGLQQKGFNNIFLFKEARPGKVPLNRVIVAPFNTQSEAERYIDDLKNIHQIKSLLLQTKLMELR